MKKLVVSAMVMCTLFVASSTMVAQDTKKEPAKKECCTKDTKDKKCCDTSKKECCDQKKGEAKK